MEILFFLVLLLLNRYFFDKIFIYCLGGGMFMNLIEFFIAWGPTFLFIVFVLIGILIGCVRGFRKSLILFVHMLVAGLISLIVYLCVVNNPNLDSNIYSLINKITVSINGSTLQEILNVQENCSTLRGLLTLYFAQQQDSDTLFYWLIYENAAYIGTIVDLTYHMIIAIFCFILYWFLIFIFYIIYLIAYPVRKKIKKENIRYQNGEIRTPYKKRRLLGSLIGGVRSILTGVICFSFLGSLIYVVSGGTNLPKRDEYKEETIDFQDETFNSIYDYYSYVCAMGNTGIFQVLNGIKDSNSTPFYFYFADLVLQGKIQDQNLGIENEKFYIRDEVGEYVHFLNSTLALFLKYADAEQVKQLLNDKDNEAQMEILMNVMQKEEFASEFTALIDEFEGKPFMANLCLSSLTSMINHIDLVVKDMPEQDQIMIIAIIDQLFKSEEAIKVSDLATEVDIKNLFKGLVQVVSDVASEPIDLSDESSESQIKTTKRMISIVQKFLPTIQNLSLFKTRADVGNKVIKGLYKASLSTMEENEVVFEVPDNIDWVMEFNILLDACDPLLTIAYEIVAENEDEMIQNLTTIFEGEKAEEMEVAFDDLSENLVKSQLLDAVFKSSIIGTQIDQIVISIANDETAKIPKDINYVGEEGECSILLKSLKIFLKNGGGTVLRLMLQEEAEISSEAIREMITVLTKEITIDNQSTSVVKTVIQSKLLHYLISTYLTYTSFGAFKLYLPEDSVEIKQECKIIKHSEIEIIADLLSNCVNLIVNLIDDPEHINYAEIFSDQYIRDTVHHSLLLQGTLANVIIGVSLEQAIIILPETFDDPESWLTKDESQGEICKLIDSVFSISEIKTEEDSYLVNELMNGEIKPATLLNLERSVINQLCASKVLRYTISDMITNIGESNFQIVVAYASIEEINAKTTTEKLVNVIKADELGDIFVDIQRIIDFDENGEIKVKYNAIFENKKELSENLTITVTIIQLIYQYNTDGFLIIPEAYNADFEKLKTSNDLNGNAWLGDLSYTEDDELYLMLSAIETFIDKDENGKIPEDFDFNTIQDTLKLREDGIDEICASVILNASVSNKIVNTFYVPSTEFEDLIIEKTELDKFFKAVFDLFGQEEILVKDLDDDLFNFTFKKYTTAIILDSSIFRATISHKMAGIEELSIPASIASHITYANKEETGDTIEEIELQKVFETLFEILNTEEIMVNDIQLQLTDLELRKATVERLSSSYILRATISNEITKYEQITILLSDTYAEELLDETMIHSVYDTEFSKFLTAVFVLLNTDRIVMNELDQQLATIQLAKENVDSIMSSSILQATISQRVVGYEQLDVPVQIAPQKAVLSGEDSPIVSQDELKKLFDALFVLFSSDVLVVNELNEQLQEFDLSKEMMDTILSSRILRATISNRLLDTSVLEIPSILLSSFITTRNVEKEEIEANELHNFFTAVFTTNKDTISGTSFKLEEMILPTTVEDAEKMMNSIIASATLSKEIMVETSSVCIIDELKVPYTYLGTPTEKVYVDQKELIRLILALTVALGKTETNNLSIETIDVPLNDAEKQNALVESEIIRATISQKVLNQEAVCLATDALCLDISRHYQSNSIGILTQAEILKIIRGLELLNSENEGFDNLVLDVALILQMENKEEVITAIADSDVYRSIMSNTLGEEKSGGIQAYEMFITAQSTALIEGQIYTYRQSNTLSGYYTIQYPTSSTMAYTSFELSLGNAFICSRMDILALQYLSS